MKRKNPASDSAAKRGDPHAHSKQACWPSARATRAAPPSSDDDEAQLAIAVAAEMARGREENLYIEKTRGLLRLMRHALSCPAARGRANAPPCPWPTAAKCLSS